MSMRTLQFRKLASFCIAMKGLLKPPTNLIGTSSYVCSRCTQLIQLHRQLRFPSTVHRAAARHGFRHKLGEKEAQAEAEWQEKARAIRAGEQDSVLKILEERGFVHALTE